MLSLLVLLKLLVETAIASSPYTINESAPFDPIEYVKEKIEVKYPPIFHPEKQSPTLLEWNQRRDELKFGLQSVVYGFFPNSQIERTFEKIKEVEDHENGLKYEEWMIKFPSLPEGLKIRLSVFIPLNIDSPRTTIITLNKCGNQSLWTEEYVTWDQTVQYPPKCYKKKKYKRASYMNGYPIKEIVGKGYIFATLSESDLRVDNGKVPANQFVGNIQTAVNSDQSWGALTAWAWGLQKGVDLLSEHPNANKEKIILFGHSRRGKAALLAAAFDERVGLVIPHMSGTGGVAPFRGSFGRESARAMVGYGLLRYNWIGEPTHLAHFFSPGFKKFAKFNNRFKVDTHQLISLMAPRKIFDIQGSRDFWAGPEDSFKNLRRAQPVYEMLGAKGIVQEKCYRDFKRRKRRTQCTRLPEQLNEDILGDVFQIRLRKGHGVSINDWNLIFKVLPALSY